MAVQHPGLNSSDTPSSTARAPQPTDRSSQERAAAVAALGGAAGRASGSPIAAPAPKEIHEVRAADAGGHRADRQLGGADDPAADQIGRLQQRAAAQGR